MSDALGEIVGSDSQVLEVQCHKLYYAPPFGSFIRADCVGSDVSHFAVVTRVSTAPFDSSRVVQAHGLPPGELEQRKPHLPSLFRTVFQARVIGYRQGEGVLSGTAPQPPRIHCFVYAATPEEIRAITAPTFLRPLTQTPEVPLEDLLVAALQTARDAWGGEGPRQLIQWGKYLARLLHQDYVTLEGVMQRLAPAPLPRPAAASVLRSSVASGTAAPGWEAPLPLAGNGTARGTRASHDTHDPFENI